MIKELVYLASPYSSDAADGYKIMIARFEMACIAASRLMAKGMLVFSPIAHTHSIAMYGGLPRGWDYWESYDRAMLTCCKTLYVLTIGGWHKSKGILEEIAIARELKLPIKFVDEKGDVL